MLPLAWMHKLFTIFSNRYGSDFDYKFDTDDDETQELKLFWAEQLGDFTKEELKRGVDALRFEKRCPSLSTFQQLCRPALDYVAAYHEAQREYANRESGREFNFSHPAIFWAIVKMGENDFKFLKFDHIKERWKNALSAVLALGVYADISPIVKALPAPSSQEFDGVLMAENINIVKKMNFDGFSHDPKRWAHKILEESEKHPARFPHISKKFAKEALGK